MAAAEPVNWAPPDSAVPAVVAAQEARDVWSPEEPQGRDETAILNPGEMPTLHSLRCTSTLSGAARSSRAHAGSCKQALGDPNFAAALGGVLALTGSVLSYTIARVKHGKRVRKLENGLQAKEHALAATTKELQHAKKQLAVLKEADEKQRDLEVELQASRDKLEQTTQELEAARAEKQKTERDYKVVKDQLHTVATSKQQAAEAIAAAEQRIAAADKARQDAEQRWKQAYADLDAAQAELENVKGELGLRGSQLQGLTRELEFTRRQLLEAEKRVERAQMESRSARTGYGADFDLPSWD